MSCALRKGLAIALAIMLGALLLACSSTPAPVEDRSARASGASRLTDQSLYRVQRGDTLYSIAFNFGLDWKDVAGWNGIARPYTIYPGQELRLAAPAHRSTAQTGTTTRPAGSPPSATTKSTTATTTASTPRATTRPAPDEPPAPATMEPAQAPASLPPSASPSDSPSASSPAASAPVASAASAPAPSGPLRDPVTWVWPTEGRAITRFNAADPARKGIDIAGREGQDIIASAAGDVVYSGSGLIGFGELIIIKHSDSMLTAYAHNRRRLVQEGERVAAGSRIAEMGQNDQEKTMLHFELRIDGKPVDPLKYLPPR